LCRAAAATNEVRHSDSAINARRHADIVANDATTIQPTCIDLQQQQVAAAMVA